MVKKPDLRIAGSVFEVRSTQARTSGGSSETGQNALTVRPCGRPSSPEAVSTTTPDGKLAMISRGRMPRHRCTPMSRWSGAMTSSSRRAATVPTAIASCQLPL